MVIQNLLSSRDHSIQSKMLSKKIKLSKMIFKKDQIVKNDL